MRWNRVCVAGLAISGVSAAFLWIPLFLVMLGFSSSETQSEEILKTYLRAFCVLYIIGVLVSFLTPLGGLLHLPGLAIVFLYEWSWPPSGGLSPWTALAAVSAVGTGLILASMFIQRIPVEPSGEVKPLPRLRTWVLGPKPENARVRFIVPRMPKVVKVVLLTLLSACIVIIAAAFLYVTSHPVSSIDIDVYADVYTYGRVHVTVYIDDVKVIDRYLESTNESQWLAAVGGSWNVTAGEHVVTAHYTNSTSGNLDDIPEHVEELRVLPFSEEYVQIGIGVAWA